VLARDLNYDFHSLTGSSSKIRLIQPATVSSFAKVDRAILLTPRAFPQNLVPLRAHLQRSHPIVGFVHALSDITTPSLVFELMCDELGASDAIICSSKAGKQVLENLLEDAGNALGIPASKTPVSPVQLPVLPLGVFTEQFQGDRGASRTALGIAEGEILILAFGRLTPLAKADLGPLLLTFSEVLKHTTRKIRLIIAGDDSRHGNMKEHLEKFAFEVGCGNFVTVQDNVSREKKQQLYSAADLFIAPSDHLQETFGIALVEALAAGLPVIASDWSGFREVVDDGVNGFLIPTLWPDFERTMELVAGPTGMEFRNSLIASATIVDQGCLRAKLVQLIEHDELRQVMGRNGREKARCRYDWRVVVQLYEQLFEQLIATTSRQPRRMQRQSLFCYDAQQAFRHYPTRAIDWDMRAVITGRGQHWLKEKFALSTLPEIQPDMEISTLLLAELCADGKPRTFRELVQLGTASRPRLAAIWLVGRLIKYGLIELVQATDPSNENTTAFERIVQS
jgi:glycosyltransferase involved in cell wall biosynthesis